MTKYKKNERIPFTDDLMFSLVVRDENICRQLLERILPDEKFGEIRIENADDDLYVETQRSIKFPLGAHGVRLDAFIKSGNVWAEIELQTYTGDHIAKRSRYYQANMDLDFLNEGHKYRELPRSYVIFICTYDYIGADLPVYFFEKFDRQNCLQFGDEAYSIIFNTDEWRRRHMTLQELMDRNYEQGLEKGRAEGESFGKEQMRFEMARSMKEDGEDAERIAKYTGLPIDEIKKL